MGLEIAPPPKKKTKKWFLLVVLAKPNKGTLKKRGGTHILGLPMTPSDPRDSPVSPTDRLDAA